MATLKPSTLYATLYAAEAVAHAMRLAEGTALLPLIRESFDHALTAAEACAIDIDIGEGDDGSYAARVYALQQL